MSAAAIVAGILVMTTSLWAGGSHTIEGANWVERLSTPLQRSGSGLILLGLISALGSSPYYRVRPTIRVVVALISLGLSRQPVKVRAERQSFELVPRQGGTEYAIS
jgi:hypothetical protein